MSGSIGEASSERRGSLADHLGALPEAAVTFLEEGSVTVAALEASVRRSADGGFHAGRMMVERAPAGLSMGLARRLGIPPPLELARWESMARDLGLPLILGWDLPRRMVKLYINGSDASDSLRGALIRALDLPQTNATPHVVGLNAGLESVEIKMYRQEADARALARRVGSPDATSLADRLGALDLAAGAVVSLDVDGSRLRPRAFFVAMRPAPDEVSAPALRPLPGWDWSRVIAQAPFPPGPPRSIGLSLRATGEWTAYFKPLSAEEPRLHELEPTAVFATEAVEVGVYVEPSLGTTRAYAELGDLAVSYRIRAGECPPALIESLLGWALDALAAREGSAERALTRGSPPPPWALVPR